MLESLAAFLAVSAIVICTPGQDTALTIRNTLAGGRRAGIATAGGVAAGQAAWTVAASAGLVAILAASEPAFQALRLAGAAYLVYLGAHSLRAALARDAGTPHRHPCDTVSQGCCGRPDSRSRERSEPPSHERSEPPSHERSEPPSHERSEESRRSGLPSRRALRQGLLSNLGNPKMAVFFASLLPQFAPQGSGSFAWLAALGLVFCSLTFGWLTLYALVVDRARELLAGPARRIVDAVFGAALVAFGVRLATTDR